MSLPSPFGPENGGRPRPRSRKPYDDRDESRLESNPPDEPREPVIPRLFLSQPGWRIAAKVGSERMLCYVTAPGQDYYHRIADGELYVYRGDEKVCLPCADRHGLLHYEPRSLRNPVRGLDVQAPEGRSDYDVKETIDRPLSHGAPDEDFLR